MVLKTNFRPRKYQKKQLKSRKTQKFFRIIVCFGFFDFNYKMT